MQLIDNKCPNCMGVVVRIPGTSMGECESCGSRFTLEGAPGATGAADVEEEEEERGEVSLDEFFNDFYRQVRRDDDREFSVGPELESGQGEKRARNARRYFDIDGNPDMYLVLDTTIFGSGKVGFAICEDGWYCKDEEGDVGYLNWEDFDDCRIEVDGSELTVAGYKFTSTDDDADTLFEMLCDLQEI